MRAWRTGPKELAVEAASPATPTVRTEAEALGVAVLPAQMSAEATHHTPHPMALLGVRTLVLLSLEERELTPQLVPVVESLGSQVARRDGLANRATRLLVVHAVSESTARGTRFDVGERGAQAVVRAPQLQLTHPRRVDEQCAVGKPYELAMRGRVATLSCRRDGSRSLLRRPEQVIHERRLPDA